MVYLSIAGQAGEDESIVQANAGESHSLVRQRPGESPVRLPQTALEARLAFQQLTCLPTFRPSRSEQMWPACSNPRILDALGAIVGPFAQIDNFTLAAFPSEHEKYGGLGSGISVSGSDSVA